MDSERTRSDERIMSFPSPIDAVDQLLEMLLEIPSSSVAISLEKLFDSRLSESKADAVERALKLGNTLAETARRSAKKLETKHNAETWTLPVELTVKVFSMLDTRSLSNAASTCHLLNKWANDPSCYGNLNLTVSVPNINDSVVCKFVQRAGENLKSLKLGLLPRVNQESSSEIPWSECFVPKKSNKHQGEEMSFLTSSCLHCLTFGEVKAGSFLRSLHLHNINMLNTPALCTALSACRSLLDLEIVDLHVSLLKTVECLSSYCPLMERFVFKSSRTSETRSRDISLKSITCHDFVHLCPNISSLSLIGLRVNDHQARIFLKGFPKLKFVDFSRTTLLTGSFLRNLGSEGYVLEELLLRDCPHLQENKVVRLLSCLLMWDFEFLRTLDFSNKNGLAAGIDHHDRCCDMSLYRLSELEEERPDLVIHADFLRYQRVDDFYEMEDSNYFSEGSDPFSFGSTSEGSETGSSHDETADGFESDYDFMW